MTTKTRKFDRLDIDHVSDDEEREAIRVLTRAYYADVRAIVNDIYDAIESGEITDAEDLDTWLHQTIDGSSRVIYNGQAAVSLIASDNADACEEETGEPGESDNVRCYWAMLADVREYLGDTDDLFEAPEDEDDDTASA